MNYHLDQSVLPIQHFVLFIVHQLQDHKRILVVRRERYIGLPIAAYDFRKSKLDMLREAVGIAAALSPCKEDAVTRSVCDFDGRWNGRGARFCILAVENIRVICSRAPAGLLFPQGIRPGKSADEDVPDFSLVRLETSHVFENLAAAL